jgi:hypothetical protein
MVTVRANLAHGHRMMPLLPELKII